MLTLSASVPGDSFVVNACLAKKGIDDWLAKQRYYQQDYPHKNHCAPAARVSDLPRALLQHKFTTEPEGQGNCVQQLFYILHKTYAAKV